MSGYRRRLEQDLDGWIARGLIPQASRAPILDSVPEARRLDAATVLAVIGALLAGVAVIAFAAANWAAIPRLVRLALILSAFLGSAGAAAWLRARGRETASHALLCVAALVFAACIGLTGQIFDIAGDPQAALRGAGLAALLLAAAGLSPWTAAVGLVFIGLGDFFDESFPREALSIGWLAVAAPAAAVAALITRSRTLAHTAGLGLILAPLAYYRGVLFEAEVVFSAASLILALGAGAARWTQGRYASTAAVLFGWLVCGALLWFGIVGFSDGLRGAVHSIAWLGLSVPVILLGRHDGRTAIIAAGVVSLLAAGAALLFNLGVGLLTSAMVFAGLAVTTLAVAMLLKRRGA